MTKEISLNQAVDDGVVYLRQTQWVDPGDHIELNLLGDGQHGPWVKLWSEGNEICGNPNPVMIIFIDLDWNEEKWLPWEAS